MSQYPTEINECNVVTITPIGVQCVVVHPSTSVASDGSASLIITGGTPPYSVVWNINGNNVLGLNQINLSVGEYPATVVDYYGDYSASTICVLTGETDCSFSISVNNFIPPTTTTTSTSTTTTTTIAPTTTTSTSTTTTTTSPVISVEGLNQGDVYQGGGVYQVAGAVTLTSPLSQNITVDVEVEVFENGNQVIPITFFVTVPAGNTFAEEQDTYTNISGEDTTTFGNACIRSVSYVGPETLVLINECL